MILLPSPTGAGMSGTTPGADMSDFEETQPIPAATGPDLGYQRKLTVLFTFGYFLTLLCFVGVASGLFLVPDTAFSQDVREVMFFLFGLIGPLVGFQTKSLGDQYQFHYGSSVGSKTKD